MDMGVRTQAVIAEQHSSSEKKHVCILHIANKIHTWCSATDIRERRIRGGEGIHALTTTLTPDERVQVPRRAHMESKEVRKLIVRRLEISASASAIK